MRSSGNVSFFLFFVIGTSEPLSETGGNGTQSLACLPKENEERRYVGGCQLISKWGVIKIPLVTGVKCSISE